ncbi:MAG: hypothetical protein DRN11_03975, partial [Thermoplasmata archaeon]
VIITLNACDNLSGINVTYYKVDEEEWQEYKEEIMLTAEGEHIIEFYSIDNAGNEEEVKNLTIKIDKSMPIVSIKTPEKGLYLFGKKLFSCSCTIIFGKITIEAVAHDNISGIEKVEFYLDNELKRIDKEKPYEWRYDEMAILFHRHIITVRAYDNAGNKSEHETKIWIFSI